MRTPGSINLVHTKEPCFALEMHMCAILTEKDRHCGTWKCPFYKPSGCEDWIRIEDGYGINLIPPEEANEGCVMTEYTIKTNREEADAIVNGNQRVVFRSAKVPVSTDKFVGFSVVENGETVKHPIDGAKFRVTSIMEGAPLEKGFVAISFRRAKQR